MLNLLMDLDNYSLFPGKSILSQWLSSSQYRYFFVGFGVSIHFLNFLTPNHWYLLPPCFFFYSYLLLLLNLIPWARLNIYTFFTSHFWDTLLSAFRIQLQK